ncbi:MAG TPA: serine/threonine-protein kinase [Kofleriaceae bacterium]|jgi:serine/threonine-protein kinase|nr:serine/threonine-protein kinase [Kofleriaceae bacterium]
MLGRSLGNYQLESVIGEGGMGVVYLARHAALGRAAAVKVLHPELSTNQSIVTRFFNEARAASAVRDPGIVEVFDFGFEDRSAYIVMEYLEGESLGDRMQRGRSAIGATLTIVRAIARALQAAHDQGIVHRDLKPDNVFLVPDPELPAGERVKLLDFGIAKLTGNDERSHTRTGTVMGTPTYMAPEQCRGSGRVDHRADLYALGCVAYEMLCGRPPFLADGPGDVFARHLYFPPLPLRSHHPELPTEIDAFVLWLLEKDPAARPAAAADVIRAVDHLAAMVVPMSPRGEPPRIQSVIRNATAPTRVPIGITTLGGAASAVTVIAPPRPRRRVLGIAAAVAAMLALAVTFVVARGRIMYTGAAGVAAAAPPADESGAPAGPHAALTAVLSSDASHGGVNRIVLSVTNRGPDPAYGVVAQLRSSSAALHGLQLSFGRIEPGETLARTRDVALASKADEIDPTVVTAVTSDNAPPVSATGKLRLATEVTVHDPCQRGTLTRDAYRIKRDALAAALAAAALTQQEFDRDDAALVSCIE